jgi:hypothetical protein
MRTALAGLLLSLWALAWLPASLHAATPIGAIYGAQMACDPALTGCLAAPLRVTVLCTVTCPFRSSFSYTDSTRFWGAGTSGTGQCVTSINSGLTWGACAAQAFTTGSDENYAGASDGSVIAASTTTGPATCTIRRSIDNAVSWSTVFTLIASCQSFGLEGQTLYCLGDGRCEWITAAGGVSKVFRSTNNGQTWALGESLAGTVCLGSGSAWDGAAGSFPSNTPAGCGGSGRMDVAAGDVWTQSAIWAGTQGDCWGAVVYNGVGRAICQAAGAAPNALYSVRDSTGGLIASLTLPGALTTSIDAGGPSIAPFTNTLYILATLAAGNTGVFISRDNLVTFNLLTTLTTTTMRGGNLFLNGGCIFITYGGPSRFAKICP